MENENSRDDGRRENSREDDGQREGRRENSREDGQRDGHGDGRRENSREDDGQRDGRRENSRDDGRRDGHRESRSSSRYHSRSPSSHSYISRRSLSPESSGHPLERVVAGAIDQDAVGPGVWTHRNPNMQMLLQYMKMCQAKKPRPDRYQRELRRRGGGGCDRGGGGRGGTAA